MSLVQEILDRGEEGLRGADLLLYNLASQIDIYDDLDVDNVRLMFELAADFGKMLGELDEVCA